MSVGEAAVDSVTDLVPTAWQSVERRRQGAQPGQHLRATSPATNDDLATRPTTVVGVTQLSGDDRRRRRASVGILLPARRLNVFVGVFNMFPLLPLDGGHAAIATYERIRVAQRAGATSPTSSS